MNKERTGRKMTRGREGERTCCNPDDGRRGNEPTKGGMKKTGDVIRENVYMTVFGIGSYFIEMRTTKDTRFTNRGAVDR